VTDATPLEAILKQMILAGGPLRLDHYMGLCLSHPAHGYYMQGDPFGARGDFVTAPEISQMFGELIGVWSVHVWQSMGAPRHLRLIELGPGRGTLMADLTRTARRLTGLGSDEISVHLIEMSPALRQAQAARLAGQNVAWHDGIDTVPDGPAILIANEFFDALPVRQWQFSNGAWAERCIGLDGADRLAIGLRPGSTPPAESLPPDPPFEGAIIEYSEIQARIATEIGERVSSQNGAALIIDYGHLGGYGDTVQALSKHRFVSPLARPGLVDITAHVNFIALGTVLKQSGAAVAGPITQGDYLGAMGLTERALRLKSSADAKQQKEIDSAVQRLAGETHATGMGRLFKVLAARHPALPVPHPFQ